MERYDLIAIGGGAAGLVTSAGAAGLGARTALIEADRLGGECLWNGCVPSKALLACARRADDARRAGDFGIEVGDVAIDFPRVMERVRAAQAGIQPHDSPERFRSLGVDVIHGTARFTGERTLAVDGRRLSAKHIVIATGSRPLVPPIDGIDAVPYRTNETIFNLEELPESLLILGAGAIGLELGQAFALLGSRVRVVERDARLLPREDRELARALGERLVRDGLDIMLGTEATAVRRRDGATVLTVEDDDGHATELEGDALLLAAGRYADTAALEPSVAGVEAGRGGVTVDERLRTTARGVWAVGDVVAGAPRFTHAADYEARLVLRNALFPFSSKTDYSRVPWVTYTDPALAHAGLTEREARERHGSKVRVWRQPFTDLDRAVVDGRTEGMVKLIADKRGRLLGGHVLGREAGTLIGEIALALREGTSLDDLADTIHPYPTYPEAISQAAQGHRKAKLSGLVERAVRWWVRR